MARYRLTKEYVETLATRGPVTFGDSLPGFWFPGESNSAGDENLGLAEHEIDALIGKGTAFEGVVEKVGGGKDKGPTAAERKKMQLDAEPASADPTEVLNELRDNAADEDEEGGK